METTVIAETKKGHRVWLQGLAGKTGGFFKGSARYDITIGTGAIILRASPEGKRKVTDAKGGIIDLTSKKVTLWAQGATEAAIDYSHAHEGVIVITRKEIL